MIEKTLNMKIMEFRQGLNEYINNSGLDSYVIYYVIKDLMREVEEQNERIVIDEYNQWNSFVQQQKNSIESENGGEPEEEILVEEIKED